MLSEPLLSGAEGPTPKSPPSSVMYNVGDKMQFCCAAVHGGFRQWWRITTDHEFLASRISRRTAWKVVVPVLSLSLFTIDLIGFLNGTGKIWWPLVDAALVSAAFAYAWSSIGTSTLFVDAFLGFLMGASGFFALEGSDMYTQTCSPLGTIFYANLMMIASFMGFHSLVIVWIWVMALASYLTLPAPSGQGQQNLVDTTVVGAVCIGLEFMIASLYRELQTELRGNQRLLDCATDGFGAVDCRLGTITQTSPKMLKTLDSKDLLGQTLTSLVAPFDHATLADFFGDAKHGVAPKPVLVTCMSQRAHFEVRMVPYKLEGGALAFCVQLVGEIRSLLPPAPSPSPSPAGERRSPRTTSGRAVVAGHVGEIVGSSAAPAATATPSVQALEFEAEVIGSAPLASQGGASSMGDDDVGEMDDSVSQVLPLPTGAATAAAAAAEGEWPAPSQQRPQSSAASSVDSSTHWLSQLLGKGPPQAGGKSRGTLSLSSWTLSHPSSHDDAKSSAAAKKKVETRTFGVQVETLTPAATKPPAPLAASTVPKPAQARALRRKRLARACAAVVEEGKPRLKIFAATPRSTRWNSLCSLVRSCNVSGSGCCAKHIAWMGLQGLISEELLSQCSGLPLCRDWQCPRCFALNDFDEDVDDDDMYDDQLCGLCRELVEPIIPTSAIVSEKGPTMAAAAASAPSPSSNSSCAASESQDALLVGDVSFGAGSD